MAGKTTQDPDSLEPILDWMRDIDRQIRTLQQPSGTQTAGLLNQVQQAIANLGAAVTAYLASGFTTGSMTATGNVSAAGAVTAGGNVNVGGYVFTTAGYAYDITYTRRTAWLGSDGRLGWASSSITAKEIRDTISPPDALTILEITGHYYERKAEIAKRDDPSSPEYRGPDYHVALEWGAIAEQLHELGLWQAVIYEWELEWELADVLDDSGHPILNADGLHLRERVGEPRRIGEPRPVGIHYELLGLLGIIATRHVWEQHSALVTEVAQLRKRIET